MRFVSYSLAAAGLSSILLSVIIVHAVIAPMPHREKPDLSVSSGWSTEVTRFGPSDVNR